MRPTTTLCETRAIYSSELIFILLYTSGSSQIWSFKMDISWDSNSWPLLRNPSFYHLSNADSFRLLYPNGKQFAPPPYPLKHKWILSSDLRNEFAHTEWIEVHWFFFSRLGSRRGAGILSYGEFFWVKGRVFEWRRGFLS